MVSFTLKDSAVLKKEIKRKINKHIVHLLSLTKVLWEHSQAIKQPISGSMTVIVVWGLFLKGFETTFLF